MKKWLLGATVATVMMTGCSTTDLMKIDGDRYFTVFQVLDDGGFLARRCTKMIGEDFCAGPVVYMPKGIDSMPYDEKVIHLKNPKVVDTYSYTNKNGDIKTVPVIVDKKE